MKKRYCIYIIKVLLIINLSGCATDPLVIDNKYNFTEFEQVDSFSILNLMSWESVDSQSLIVQTAPSVFYLLILRQKLNDLNVADAILLSSTGARVEVNRDCIEAIGPMCEGESPVIIYRIYKLNDDESVEYTKKRIRN